MKNLLLDVDAIWKPAGEAKPAGKFDDYPSRDGVRLVDGAVHKNIAVWLAAQIARGYTVYVMAEKAGAAEYLAEMLAGVEVVVVGERPKARIHYGISDFYFLEAARPVLGGAA